MVTRRNQEPSSRKTRRRPATTPEARENQLIALAVDLAARQLEDGTASAQVITHYLRLGSSREKLEQLRIEKENELLDIKREAIASQARVEELYTKALSAMQSYSGLGSGETTDDFEDDQDFH